MGRSDIRSGILLWLLTYSAGDVRRIPDPKSDGFGQERQLNKEKRKRDNWAVVRKTIIGLFIQFIPYSMSKFSTI